MTAGFKSLRNSLESERIRLLNELEQLEASGSTSDERREGSPFGKREEEATEALELEKRLALETRTREQLTAVEHALEKFEEGTYGLCDICGQKIGGFRYRNRHRVLRFNQVECGLHFVLIFNRLFDFQGNIMHRVYR